MVIGQRMAVAHLAKADDDDSQWFCSSHIEIGFVEFLIVLDDVVARDFSSGRSGEGHIYINRQSAQQSNLEKCHDSVAIMYQLWYCSTAAPQNVSDRRRLYHPAVALLLE